MQKLTGSYVWHYVNNENKIEGPEENHEYLVCFESAEETGSVWKMKLAYWYEKGAIIRITEADGTPHEFKTVKDGFYIFDDLGGSTAPRFFRLREVRYWTFIHEAGVNPDDILTVVG